MNKSMIATLAPALSAVLAAALLPGVAMAQSNVTVYGVADAALVHESGAPAGSVTGVDGGVGYGSRVGFKGTEDIGGGRKVFFVLESGIHLDTGASAQGGLLFGRQAYVGVSGEFGAVSVGRQNSPYYLAVSDISDPFCVGYAGTASNLMATNTRLDNMLLYTTPVLGGFSVQVAGAPGEQPGNSKAKRAYSGSLTYAAGPLTAALARHQQQNILGTDSVTNTLLTARYQFGTVLASVGYARNDGLADARSHDAIAGVIVPFGAIAVYGSVIRHTDERASARHASQFAVGATYSLSKRTDLYVAYAHIRNRNGASFTVGNATSDGIGNAASNLGIRHSF